MRRPNPRLIGLVLILIVVAIIGGLAWWLQPQPLLPEAEASLASTPQVGFVDAGSRLEWSPTAAAPTTGLIVYPGAKVPAPAYGPLAQAIAGQGFLVVVEEMPLNLAILGVGRADDAIGAHPEIRLWAIGGHSLGGSMAAQYASEHLTRLQGLVFWASYGIADLSASQLHVLSTWGSLDAGADKMGGPDARAKVPSDAVFVEIPGGNHEQMGSYTGQPNDPLATISREDQQRSVAASTVQLLHGLDTAGEVQPSPGSSSSSSSTATATAAP